MCVFVIDARTRELACFVAAATAAADNSQHIVLRHALDVGSLKDLLKEGEAISTGMPVLLLGGYAARSSAGFTDIEGGGFGRSRRIESVTVVGGLGPRLSRKGLAVYKVPIHGTLMRGSAAIRRIPGASSSNWATANAAVAATKLLAEIRPDSAFLMEGQSDWTSVYEVQAGEEPLGPLPTEHRSERFTEAALVRRLLRAAVTPRRREGEELPSRSEEEVAAVMAAEAAAWADALGYDTSYPNHPLLKLRLRPERLRELLLTEAGEAYVPPQPETPEEAAHRAALERELEELSSPMANLQEAMDR